jgi:hypothetical protein
VHSDSISTKPKKKKTTSKSKKVIFPKNQMKPFYFFYFQGREYLNNGYNKNEKEKEKFIN